MTIRTAATWALGTVVLITGAWWWSSGKSDAASTPAPAQEWESLARQVEVQVLNAGRVRGAARDASLKLRAAGLDVVLWGNASTSDIDSTEGRNPKILVRSGDTLGVGRVQDVLGEAEVVFAPDDRDLVDLTILLYRPPAS